MPHNLDMTTGQAAMAYVGQAPWHGLGTQLEKNASIEAWLTAARLDWTIQQVPVLYQFQNTGLRRAEDRFVLIRSDTGDALSVVSGDYHIMQPKGVVEFYRDLTEQFGYQLETAGALDGGRKVWALARTGLSGSTAPDRRDNIEAFLLLATSCDKTLATTAAFTSIRVVCQNTLDFALEELAENKSLKRIKIPHTERFDPQKVKEKLGLLDNAWTQFLKHIGNLTRIKVNDQEAYAFFERGFSNHPMLILRNL